jgi:FkbM family methyltransferase
MDLLTKIAGTDLAETSEILWFVGANTFQERALINRTFPNLKRIYLFEPLPAVAESLRRDLAADVRIEVFPYALSDYDGSGDFFVTNNQLSSSLLKLGKHSDLFPDVRTVQTIIVPVITPRALLLTHRLFPPDVLFIDAQGAERRIISAIPESVLLTIRIIIAEASIEELYWDSGTLRDLEADLRGSFEYLGFHPLPGCTIHGDALFVNRCRSAGKIPAKDC